MKSVRIGIVGLGGAGRAHVRRFRRNPRVAGVVGYDPRPDTGVEVETAPSLEALLERTDAVSICTPDHEHLRDVIRCLDAGKHVLVEKPMVASHAEAITLKQHLDRHPELVFGIHHQMRYTPAFAKAKELIAAGRLGRLFYIEANYWHDMTERSTMFDDWRMQQGQSLIFGHACHPLDLLMWLSGGAPSEQTTYLSKVGFPSYKAEYTSATTMMQFPGGLIGKSHVNSFCVFPQLNNLVILGDKGTYIDGILYAGNRFEQVATFFAEGKSYTEPNIVQIRLPRRLVSFGFSAYLRFFNWLAVKLMRHPDFGFRQYPLTVYNHDDACQAVTDNFVAAVLDQTPILVGYDDATRVIKLCEDAEADGRRHFRPE